MHGDVGERASTTPLTTTSPRAILRGIWRTLTRFYIWDISYLVAVIFVGGCIVLVLNAFLTFLPYEASQSGPSSFVTYVTGVLTSFGCVLFLISSTLAFLEAVNANKDGCAGWKVERVSLKEDRYFDEPVSGEDRESTRVVPDGHCEHHHSNKSRVLGGPSSGRKQPPKTSYDDYSWKWLPSAYELRTHYVYDIAFVACSILLLSSIIYFTASLAALISIFTTGSVMPLIRIPQLVGAAGFITSYAFFMLETQLSWFRPAIGTLGWHIGLWSAVGSAGFTLAATFGFYCNKSWEQWHLGCAYLWGE